MFQQMPRVIAIITVVVALGLVACGTRERPTPEPVPTPTAVNDMPLDQIITLGDIDPEEPAKKIKRFQPLANYLAEQLKQFDVKEGRVVIARDIEEMAHFLEEGAVDVYFDSSFPTLAVQELSGSEVILRRWKQETPDYRSLYITRLDHGISGVEDFVGKVVAFEEPHSTSGFVLPAGTLIQRGFTLSEVDGPNAPVASSEIGYFFSWDEENTIEMILRGVVAGGGISNQDYDKLPTEIKQQIVTFDHSITVPRQLVSVRSGLDMELVSKPRELLVGLDQIKEGQQILENMKTTKKIDSVPPDSEVALRELKVLMKLASPE